MCSSIYIHMSVYTYIQIYIYIYIIYACVRLRVNVYIYIIYIYIHLCICTRRQPHEQSMYMQSIFYRLQMCVLASSPSCARTMTVIRTCVRAYASVCALCVCTPTHIHKHAHTHLYNTAAAFPQKAPWYSYTRQTNSNAE